MPYEYQFSKPSNVADKLSKGIHANGYPHLLKGITFDLRHAQHVQGITGYDNDENGSHYVIMTYSYEDNTPGYIMFGDKTTGKMVEDASFQLDQFQRHPCGIQTIGDYLVVPVEELKDDGKTKDYIFFYDLTSLPGKPKKVAALTVSQPLRCIGITNFKDASGEEFYLLALPVHADEKQTTYFYKSKFSHLSQLPQLPEIGAIEDKELFDYCGQYHVNAEEACGLVTQSDDTVYFVGFRSDRLGRTYDDSIEIYEVIFGSGSSDFNLAWKELTSVTSSDGGHDGIHFRRGGGLEVLEDGRMVCYAAESHCSDKDDGGEIQYDTFDPTEKIEWIGEEWHECDDGQEVSVAMDNEGHCIEVHRQSDGDTLYYRIGNINFDTGIINFDDEATEIYTSGQTPVKGQTPSIALDRSGNGNCILLHRGVGDNDGKLFRYVAQITSFDNKEIAFKGEDTDYDKGKSPSIALDGNNNCLEVHSSDNELICQEGQVSYEDGSINFDNSDKKYTTGQTPSIELSNDGNYCAEVHRGYDNAEKLYCSVGEVDCDSGEVNYGDFKQYTTGKEPCIALDSDNNRCITVHRGQSKKHDDELTYYLGHVDFTMKSIRIYTENDTQDDDFNENKLYAKGSKPNIAMDNSGNCVEMHCGSDGKLYYRMGKIVNTID